MEGGKEPEPRPCTADTVPTYSHRYGISTRFASLETDPNADLYVDGAETGFMASSGVPYRVLLVTGKV
jgi:hypothetical protein